MGRSISTEWRCAVRLLRKQPMVSATVILALAVGIGMATTGFTFMRAVLHGTLPFAGGERFVRLTARTDPDGTVTAIEADRFRLLRDEARSLDYLGAIRTTRYNVRYPGGSVESVGGAEVSPGWFRHLPYRPVAGRLPLPADADPGAVPVVMIRRSLWERRFAESPDAIGATLDVAGVERTIVGILSDECRFPSSGELWLPITIASLDATHSGGRAGVGGILADGVTLAAARTQLTELSARFDASRPELDPIRLDLRGFTDLSAFQIGTPLVVGTAVLVMILLLVAANVANLVLARNAARMSELAVRSALGASRVRIVGQLFLEVLIPGAVAAVLGLAASQLTLDFVRHSFEVDELPFWVSFAPDAATAGFVVAITLLASAVAGAWPAWKATRRDPARALADHGTRTVGAGIGRVGGAMIVGETALSVALLSGAVVLAWGFARYAEQRVDLPRGEVLTAQLYVAPSAGGEADVLATQQEVLDAVGRLPGVAAYGAATALPRMTPAAEMVRLEPLVGEPQPAPVPLPAVGVSAGFFESLRGEVTAGRGFRADDYTPGAPPVAIVNQPFVDTVLGGRNPIGRRIRVVRADGDDAGEDWREIVGVVPDLGLLVGDAGRAAGYYVPLWGRNLFYLTLLAQGDPLPLADPLRRRLYEVDPEILVTRVDPLEAVAKEDRAGFLVMSSVLTAVGVAALTLSLVGMYAILSFTVTRRTREIGIRVALGASDRRVLQSIVGRSVLLLALGAMIGGGLAVGLTTALDRMMVSQLPDPGVWVLPAVAGLLALAGTVASWVPARRALRIRPTEALRHP